jgi:hypothetical protein
MASIVSAGTTSATALNMSADTTGVLQLASNNGTVGMTMDTSQNVGIGTSSPNKTAISRALTVNGSANAGLELAAADVCYGLIFANSTRLSLDTNNSGGNLINFYTSNAERMRIDPSGNLLIGGTSTTTHPALNKFVSLQSQTNNDVVGYALYVNEGTNSRRGSLFLDDSTGLFGLDVSAGSGVPNIVFRTAGTEHVRIDTSGRLIIGGTSSNHKLLVVDNVDRTEGTSQFSITGSGYSAYHFMDGTAYYIGQNSNSRQVRMYAGSQPTTGVTLGVGATSWSATSDERKKDIIEDITDATQKLSGLRTVIGKYKTDDEEVRRSFLIAQDVQAVFPEAIGEDQDGTLNLRYTDLIPVLVKAIQELNAKVTSLEEQVLNLGVK